MGEKSIQDQIIANYQKDEGMMILVYAQWCINNHINPKELYLKAYPDQKDNEYVMNMLNQTVPIEESGGIDDHVVLNVLSLFGNEDLAFHVNGLIEKRNRSNAK